MSYLIQPDSDVILLTNIPLDLEQEHSICFDTKERQYSYFTQQRFLKYRLADYSYQRYNLGVIKVEKTTDDLYNVNYMMFRNTAFGNKWFYAFVTSVEYINNVTTAIYYEIDPLQTWLFDFDIGQSFVVREMPVTDYANEQLVDEPLETGEYVISRTQPDSDFASWTNTKICVLTTNAIILKATNTMLNTLSSSNFYSSYGLPIENEMLSALIDFADVGGVNCGTLPSGMLPLFFPNDSIGRKNLRWYINCLQSYNQTDSILSMFLVPSFVANSASYSVAEFGAGPTHGFEVSCSINNNEQDYPIYYPQYIGMPSNHITDGNIKNMKLFNYPYCFPFISDGQGNIHPFKPQLFTNDDAFYHFQIGWCCSSTLEVLLTPKDYKGMDVNYEESYTINKFPQISWITDYFREYWARNKINIGTSLIGDFISGGTSIATGMMAPLPSQAQYNFVQDNFMNLVRRGYSGQNHPEKMSRRLEAQMAGERMANIGAGIGGAVGSALDIANTIGNIGIARRTSDRNNGTQSTDYMASINKTRPFAGIMSITKEMAQVIDDYFTRFGYATNRSKVPNWRTNQRPYFNYVQTKDTVILGDLPQEDAKEIVGIFEKGITWWKNTGDYIGAYSTVDNRASARGKHR